MSEAERIKAAARARLFDTALAQVVREGADAAGTAVRRTPPARWLAAALVLLGGLVTVGVAWLQREAGSEAQDPVPFDPIFPTVERELTTDRIPQVHDLAQLERLPKATDALVVTALRPSPGVDPELVIAATRHPGLRALWIAYVGERLPAVVWEHVGRMPALEILSPGKKVTAADLRELRRAPRLRTLYLPPGLVLDPEVAAALNELPKLSCLYLSLLDARSDGIAALAGSPNLEALSIQGGLDPGWAEAVGNLTTLRWLHVHGRKWPTDDALPFGPEDARHLATLPRLSCLILGAVDFDEAAIDALPPSLEVLWLSDPQPLGAAGLRRLASLPKLRGLELGSVAPEDTAALVEVLAELPLERFGYYSAMPEAVWGAVGRLSRLRRLSIDCGDDVAADVARCGAIATLEQLTLRTRNLPTIEALAPLADLRSLRRFELSGTSGDFIDQVAALRTKLQERLGPDVAIVMR